MTYKKTPITFLLSREPITPDPIEYDFFVHHEAFRSVLGGICSNYKKGGYIPILAEKWEWENERQKLIITLRHNITFSNGDSITAEAVILSWTRLAYLMKQKGSHSELFCRMKGIESLRSPISKIAGLQARDNTVVIELTSPSDDIIEILSFGFNAIVHPNDFDHVTGAWKNPKKITSASFYELTEWNDDHLLLKLRPNFLPHLRHPRAFEEVLLVWDETKTYQLKSGQDRDAQISDMKFLADDPTGIIYAHVSSWARPNSPLYDEQRRRALRDAFLAQVEKNGEKVVRSLFPFELPAWSEVLECQQGLQSDEIKNLLSELAPIKFVPSKVLRKKRDFKTVQKTWKQLQQKHSFSFTEVELNQVDYQQKQEGQCLKSDLYLLASGVWVDKPYYSAQFIFGKDGIRLSDSDGRITQELAKGKNCSLQRINEIMWEQAVVWPIFRQSDGLWHHSSIDVSWLNPIYPMEFAFVGAKA